MTKHIEGIQAQARLDFLFSQLHSRRTADELYEELNGKTSSRQADITEIQSSACPDTSVRQEVQQVDRQPVVSASKPRHRKTYYFYNPQEKRLVMCRAWEEEAVISKRDLLVDLLTQKGSLWETTFKDSWQELRKAGYRPTSYKAVLERVKISK